MVITSLIENTSVQGLPVEHGLSLHIHMNDGQNILFDMGQSEQYWHNAQALGINLKATDVAVVSHGHYDHGGGLEWFLKNNQKASVYIHKDAFMPHYSMREEGLVYIGLNQQLAQHPRLRMCEETTHISEHLTLFAQVQGHCCYPPGNRLLYGPKQSENDSFCHEQNLLVEEGDVSVLIAGCAHRGIVNILSRATELLGHAPTYVLAGMHLKNSGLTQAKEKELIGQLANELMRYSTTRFYTMHCTGEEQFAQLRAIMGSQIEYLSGGESIKVEGNR